MALVKYLHDMIFYGYIRTYQPWRNYTNCSQLMTRFSPKRLPVVYLASFPSSGNTWIRYMLEGATGIFTGSLYDDWKLSACECVSTQTITMIQYSICQLQLAFMVRICCQTLGEL